MFLNTLIEQFDNALRTLHGVGIPERICPEPQNTASAEDCSTLSPVQSKHSAGLMRVNHVGEVCAQALYAGQALTAKTLQVRQFNAHAALEERDHLLWTVQRLQQLNAKPSVLNPFWYGGAWAMGALAGRLGDTISLSFVQETEAQVEAHLHSHEALLPDNDWASRAIVAQMKIDEAAHGAQAHELGAVPLPAPIRFAMRLGAKAMTKTAYYL